MNDADKKKFNKVFQKIIDIVSKTSDEDIPKLLGDGALHQFMESIAKPTVSGGETPYEYLLRNKNRLHLLALLRQWITWNYSMKGKVENSTVFISPTYIQWYPDGVMFMQGKQPFEGLIGLFEDGEIKFAITKRDIKSSDVIGKDDLLFVSVDEARTRSQQPTVPKEVHELDETVQELERILAKQETNEQKYQEFFMAHPWIFGAQYKSINSHKAFNDQNIPDFTGVRVRDSARDIFEIKPPTLLLFQENNELRAEFNAAWNQAERYLDFARREADYLYRQKGLLFDNPHCFLLAGHNLTNGQVSSIRLKERLNPAITVLTYNDVLAFAKATVSFIKQLRGQEGFKQATGDYEKSADCSSESHP